MKPAAEPPRHYAVRRVNPFEGVLQVVETHNARAYSPNGVIWQVQVLTERPDHTWRSHGRAAPIEQFFNFGLWDATDGLQQIPANPVMDIGAMTDAADHLIAVLHEVIEQVPFDLIDGYECWATDSDGEPIALLATTEDPAFIEDMRVERWQATRVSDHGFVSDSLRRGGVPNSDGDGPRRHARELERQVGRRCRQRAWFRRRRPDRSGERLDPPDGACILAAGLFPPLGLATDWPQDSEAELVRDYLEWQAPRLLMLQDIGDELRGWLEPLACRQAEELAAGYRLIPQIIDSNRLEAARVEARLRRAAV